MHVGHIENGRSFLWMFFVVRTSENWIAEVNGTVLVVLIFNSSTMARELYFELSTKFYSQKTIGYVALHLNGKDMKNYFMFPRIIFHAVFFCSESD